MTQFFHTCSGRSVRMPAYFAILLFGLTPSTLFAEIYRCVDGTGKVKYSDTHCDIGSQTEQLKIQTNTYDGSVDRKAAAQTKKPASSKPMKAPAAQLERAEAEPASLINSAACRDAMRSYEIVAGSFEQDAEEIASKNWQAEIKCGIAPGTKTGKTKSKK